MSKVEHVHFTVTGEFITRHSRDLVLEGTWQEGVRFLKTSLIGIDYELIFKVLAGSVAFTGDSNTGVNPVEKQDAEYMRKVDWLYGGYIKIDRKWYRPYAYVINYGPADYEDYCKPGSDTETKDSNEIVKGRARHYCRNRISDKIYILKCPDGSEHPVLFELVDDPPIWMDVRKTQQQSLDSCPHVAADGYTIRYGEKGEYDNSRIKETWKDPVKFSPREEPVEEEKPVPPPDPDPKLKYKYGWVSPDGTFYGCEYAGHVTLADQIVRHCLGKMNFDNNWQVVDNNGERELEKAGWMKIGGLGTEAYVLKSEKDPTQAQQDTIWDWCKKHKARFPDHLFED